ncbi:MAG: translation initiation factor IF-2 [Armatimonadota bacterium]
MHFFKLAQELGVRPVELQKKLAAEGIAVVQSTSSMLDEQTAATIRDFLHRETAAANAAAAPAPASETAPVETPAPVAEPTPTAEPAAAAVPAATPATEPATEPVTATAPATPLEERPVTRVIKRKPGADGQSVVQRTEQRPSSFSAEGRPAGDAEADAKRKAIRRNLLITPEVEGGLSPDAEFGIVKAAGIIPIPAARPPRPQQRPEGGGPPYQQRPPQQGGFARPPREGGMGQNIPPAGGEAGKPAAAKGGPVPAKKKQKRTVFSEKEKTRLQNRRAEFTSTTIRSRRKRRDRTREETEAVVFEGPIIINGPMTIGELSELVNMAPAQIISQLIGMGILATMNQQIEPEQATEVLVKLGLEASYVKEMAEQASWRLTSGGSEAITDGEIRPPVVTILGHVDHGKTTLLDSIRKTNVTAQEFGGITQHIGAYQVEIKGHKITFLDTPGHAAFTAMRARGANLTDIAILVVAADDGIQPQTIEAIDHAKAAKVPIIVAINKVDLIDAQPEVVKQQLTGHELVSEEWGGDTIMVPLSAKKGTNIEQLLEMILLVSEVQELRADADKPASGAVVESQLDKQRGPIATVLVQEGTLRVGDAVVVGMISGKVRAMSDDKGQKITEAGPSTPVEITGLAEVPVAGDLFEVVASERKAREIAETRQNKARDERLQTTVSLQNLSNMVASGSVQDLNVIVKTDVAGSIEAISHALSEIEHAEIRVNIIHAGVGDITESDVLLASASQAIIVGFHVRTEPQARLIAEEASIDVRLYQVIYDLVDDIKKAMTGMLTPIFAEVVLGHAEVRAVFKVTRAGTIAGCYVTDGVIKRGSKLRVKREGASVYEGNLDSLKHLKEDVREMAQGFECGIGVDKFDGWKEGDVIEGYVMQEQRREMIL